MDYASMPAFAVSVYSVEKGGPEHLDLMVREGVVAIGWPGWRTELLDLLGNGTARDVERTMRAVGLHAGSNEYTCFEYLLKELAPGSIVVARESNRVHAIGVMGRATEGDMQGRRCVRLPNGAAYGWLGDVPSAEDRPHVAFPIEWRTLPSPKALPGLPVRGKTLRAVGNAVHDVRELAASLLGAGGEPRAPKQGRRRGGMSAKVKRAIGITEEQRCLGRQGERLVALLERWRVRREHGAKAARRVEHIALWRSNYDHDIRSIDDAAQPCTIEVKTTATSTTTFTLSPLELTHGLLEGCQYTVARVVNFGTEHCRVLYLRDLAAALRDTRRSDRYLAYDHLAVEVSDPARWTEPFASADIAKAQELAVRS